MKFKLSKIISNKEITKIKRIINKNKPIVFLLATILLTTIGGTFAFYYSVHVQENDFNIADYNITLEEYFPVSEWDDDNILDKEVKITNNGNSDVLLRVTYNEIWYNGNDIVNNMHDGTHIVDKNWSQEFVNDFEYSDGWYYYKKVLGSGQSIVILETIEKVVDVYNDSTSQYQLDFNYEVLQVKNSASSRVWGKEASIEGSNVQWEL